jgi:RNA polymerase sigma-70 factor (ECF subfamily)
MATALVLDPYVSRMTLPGDGNPLDERSLVGRAQRGDADAFEVLYRTHAGRVFALCLRLTGERARATALLQDAFVRAWERLGTFRGDAALTTWLHRLTVNCFFEEARKTRRREAHLEIGGSGERHEGVVRGAAAPPTRRSAGSPGSDPFARTAAATDFSADADVRMDLESALPQLADGARRVFVLHDMYGYRHDEIATLLGVATSTVRVQLFRARKQLMEILDR